MSAGLLLLLLLAPTSANFDADDVREHFMPHREGYQTAFFAVIEGAYRDGLSNEHLAIILEREEPKEYENFVYACPLCSPAIAALELYRSRPPRLYSLKGAGSTFGFGILPDIAFLIESENVTRRLLGIRLLLQRWIDAYLESKNLTQQELDGWRRNIEAAKEEGARLLKQYREGGSAHLTAPAFEEVGDCAVCQGSFEGASRASGVWHFMAPSPEPTALEGLSRAPRPEDATTSASH